MWSVVALSFVVSTHPMFETDKPMEWMTQQRSMNETFIATYSKAGFDSLNVRFVGSYDTPGRAYGVYVSGGYAYVADWNAGLRVIDVSDPENPVEIGYYDTPGYAHGVYISGSYAYVADGDWGLRVIDVSDPSNPEEVGYYDTPGFALGVYVSGGYAYVADVWAGLRVINVSDPSNLEEVGYYDTPDWAYGVYVSGDYAYVADWDAGLQIYQFYGVGVAETSTLPDKLVLYHSWPNPFTSGTCIRFAIPQVDGCDKPHVTLSIYDITGRLIRTLVDDKLSAGYYSVKWHADNDVGQRVAQGIYLCELKLQARGLHARCTSKLIHIR